MNSLALDSMDLPISDRVISRKNRRIYDWYSDWIDYLDESAPLVESTTRENPFSSRGCPFVITTDNIITPVACDNGQTMAIVLFMTSSADTGDPYLERIGELSLRTDSEAVAWRVAAFLGRLMNEERISQEHWDEFELLLMDA